MKALDNTLFVMKKSPSEVTEEELILFAKKCFNLSNGDKAIKVLSREMSTINLITSFLHIVIYIEDWDIIAGSIKDDVNKLVIPSQIHVTSYLLEQGFIGLKTKL